MDAHLAALVDLGRSAQPGGPAVDLVDSLFRIPAVRSFLLSLPASEPDKFGRLREHFADRPEISELLDVQLSLIQLRLAAAQHAAAELTNIARRN